MKRIILALAVLSAVVAGCQTEPMNEPSETDRSSAFEASTEVFAPATRTSMTQDKQVVWSEDDLIAVFQGSTLADKYVVSASSAGQSNATFDIVADNSSLNGSFSAGTELPCNVALYPYADGLSLSGSALEEEVSYEISGVVIPAAQTYVAGSFANGAFPMVAVTETMADHNLKFKNVFGAMKLQLKGTQTVKSIKVEGKNSEKLSGAATVTVYADNAAPAVTMTGTDDAAKAVTLDCGAGVALSESAATDFIIALPPVLFSQGFTVTVTDSDDETHVIETSTANAVLRSSILVMPVVTLDDDTVYVEYLFLDKNSLTMYPSTSYTLETDIDPMDVTDPTLTWSSSDNTVATVDQSGKVTAVADGTTTITVLAVGGASATCSVTVKSATAVANKKYVVGDADYGYGIAIGDVIWAPVNCGYEPAADDYKGYPYGKLYQWGRKYGQGYNSDDASYPSGENLVAGPVMPSVGKSDENADLFFTVSESPYDWCKVPNDALWNSGTEDAPIKTANDPCPTGWRVPTSNELSKLQQNSSRTTNDAGQSGRSFSGEYTFIDGAPKVFFPAAGYRYDSDGYAYTRGYIGDYWSSRPNSYDACGLEFYDGNVYMGSGSRAYGFSVRCVQVTDGVAEL